MSFLEQFEVLFEYKHLIFASLGYSLMIALVAVVIGFIIGIISAAIKIAPQNNVFINLKII